MYPLFPNTPLVRSKEVRVLLYHGRVSVLDRTAPAPAGKELQLAPGQEMIASVGAGAPPTRVSFDPERSSSWEAGQLRARKSVGSGKSVSVRVDIGGRRVSQKKMSTTKNHKV